MLLKAIMIWCCVLIFLNISNVTIVTAKGIDYYCIIHNFRKSVQFICCKIPCLMIVDIYKMHLKEIIIKKKSLQLLFWRSNHRNNNNNNKKKSMRKTIGFGHLFQEIPSWEINKKSVLSWINRKDWKTWRKKILDDWWYFG